jgi:hypothetical protein
MKTAGGAALAIDLAAPGEGQLPHLDHCDTPVSGSGPMLDHDVLDKRAATPRVEGRLPWGRPASGGGGMNAYRL